MTKWKVIKEIYDNKDGEHITLAIETLAICYNEIEAEYKADYLDENCPHECEYDGYTRGIMYYYVRA